MYQTLKGMKRLLVLGMMCSLTTFVAATVANAMKPGHDMATHHQHMMLNHALGMALEGSDLIMLGNMDIAKGVDAAAVEHGNMMVKNGTALFTETISGKTMTGVQYEGKDPMKDPAMAYTHKLAEAQL